MTITERYNDLKAKEPGVLVLMRCGDFYETYDADAKVCNEVLGLALTQRNGKAQVLTGFPKHALDAYLPKLIRAGHRVSICDDINNNNSNNNNSNNNQTIMEQNFAAMRVKNVYWFNREREALVQLTLVSSSFNLISHKARHEWAETDGDPKKVVLTMEYNPQEPGNLPCFYESVEKFEKGETIKHDDLYHMNNEQTVCSELLKGTANHTLHNDEKGCFVWAFIKGRAVKWYFRKNIDWVTWHYEKRVVCRATSDADDGVPENYYSCEEVYQYNDWTEVKPDGTRVKHEGVYNRLRLEHDQEELADRLQQAIDACKAAGMYIYFNYASYDLNAVNVRHIERLDYDPEVNEETEVAHYFDDSRVACAFKNVGDLNTEDSEVKFVVKKEDCDYGKED